MKERPILFKDAMVRAILDGRKTQTRRVIKPQPKVSKDDEPFVSEAWDHGMVDVDCPHGQTGDRLWVREAWRQDSGEANVDYRADGQPASILNDEFARWRWKPSIYLRREHSRILLEVTGVRVQRLQQITDADALAEGARFTDFGLYVPNGKASLDGGKTFHPFKSRQHSGWHMDEVTGPDECLDSARAAFANYINKLHGGKNWNCKPGPSLWDANQWVWVIEFERVRP